MDRRDFIRLVGGAATLSAVSDLVSADTVYPARPVRILAGFAAGGGVDITARLIGQ
jgi:tripartite-type tricarboxylate transporter receptor subunit TctC